MWKDVKQNFQKLKRGKNHKTKKVSLNEARLFVIIERNPLKKKTHDLAHFDYKRSETWLLKYTRRLPLIGPAGGVSKVTT